MTVPESDAVAARYRSVWPPSRAAVLLRRCDARRRGQQRTVNLGQACFLRFGLLARVALSLLPADARLFHVSIHSIVDFAIVCLPAPLKYPW